MEVETRHDTQVWYRKTTLENVVSIKLAFGSEYLVEHAFYEYETCDQELPARKVDDDVNDVLEKIGQILEDFNVRGEEFEKLHLK